MRSAELGCGAGSPWLTDLQPEVTQSSQLISQNPGGENGRFRQHAVGMALQGVHS